MNKKKSRPPLFALGTIFITPAARDQLARNGIEPMKLLVRHVTGDWGDVPPEDAAANTKALYSGCRILSSYRISEQVRIWVITEALRESTTLLLPDDY
jgi:hypothetical protein